MARGNFVLITEKGELLYSTQFINGDMYLEGHGLDVYDTLQDIWAEKDFILKVEEFNKEIFQYKDSPLYYKEKNLVSLTKKLVKKHYFEEWHSDYLYIKNAACQDVIVKDFYNRNVILEKGKVTVLYFGRLVPESEIEAVRESEKQKRERNYKTDPEDYCTICGEYSGGLQVCKICEKKFTEPTPEPKPKTKLQVLEKIYDLVTKDDDCMTQGQLFELQNYVSEELRLAKEEANL